MQRIRLTFFCVLGRHLQNLTFVGPQTDLRQSWGTIYGAQRALEELLGTSWLSPALRTSSESGTKLLAALRAITDRPIDFTSAEPQAVGMGAYAVSSCLEEFSIVLNSEFSHSDTFYVSQKAAYDTSLLIDRAEIIFPSDLGVKVPEAVQEARAAGKCLAFELPTAAGFHTMRMLEAVVRAYCKAIGAEVPAQAQRNMGVYLKQIQEKRGEDNPVFSTLRQVKNLHRNPLIHEVSLDLGESIALFGIAGSAIEAMLKEIPNQGDTQLSFGVLAALSGM